MPKLEVLPKRIEVLDTNDKSCSFRANVDVLNECFGLNKSVYFRACYPQKSNEFINGTDPDDKFIIWMPKLYGNSSNWKNTISLDGCIITEMAEADRDNDWIDDGKLDVEAIRLTFVKLDLKSPYRFVGAYVIDKMDHLNHSYRRIATKVRIMGNPVAKIELLDDCRKEVSAKMTKENFLSSLSFLK